MSPRVLVTYALISFYFATAGTSSAVEGDAAPSLTLSQALALAHRLNETREVAAARLAHALALRRQAIALLIPTLSASASTQKSSISSAPFGASPSENNSAQVDVNLTLFNASTYPEVRAAGVNVAAQALDSSELRRSLAFQVAGGFINVIAAERQLQAAERRRAVAAQTAEQTRARVQAGVATANDATRSDLELATAELTVTNDRQAVLVARLSLADLLNAEVATPLQEPELATLPARELSELEIMALRERADLHSSALRIRANDLQAEGTRLGAVPTIGVRGTYLLRDSDPPPVAANSPQWQVALVAQWSIYDGGNRAAVAEALDADRREANATLSAAKRGLHRDLATSLGALATAEAAVAQAENQLKVAKLNADEVQAKFRQGLATALQAADANAAVFQAESDLTNRQLDLQSARFQLRQLVGRWPLADGAPSDNTVPAR